MQVGSVPPYSQCHPPNADQLPLRPVPLLCSPLSPWAPPLPHPFTHQDRLGFKTSEPLNAWSIFHCYDWWFRKLFHLDLKTLVLCTKKKLVEICGFSLFFSARNWWHYRERCVATVLQLKDLYLDICCHPFEESSSKTYSGVRLRSWLYSSNESMKGETLKPNISTLYDA